MHLEDAKILIADDSILARKQLKDMISTLGTPVFFEAKMVREPLINTSKTNRILFFWILLCQTKTVMPQSKRL